MNPHRRAQRSGRAWEAQLLASAARYRTEARAMVVQAFPDGRQRRGPVDLVGCLADGRAFLAEAKSTTSARWGFDLLAPHQALQLRDADALGAVTGILLRTSDGDCWVAWERFGLRWLQWKTGGVDRGEASLTFEDGIEIAPCAKGLPDWLPAVLS